VARDSLVRLKHQTQEPFLSNLRCHKFQTHQELMSTRYSAPENKKSLLHFDAVEISSAKSGEFSDQVLLSDASEQQQSQQEPQKKEEPAPQQRSISKRTKIIALTLGALALVVFIAALVTQSDSVMGIFNRSSTLTDQVQDDDDGGYRDYNVRYYTLVISYATMSPDGFPKEVMVINGTIPGPLISANVGQTLEIKVINELDVPTTLHWHGMFQNGTSYYDGVDGVTQCGIPAGSSAVYRFKVDQTGTYWYHSHFGGQYGNGHFGPLVIYDTKEPYTYDEDVVVSFSDWYHNTIESLMVNFLSAESQGMEPVPDAGLINGKGMFDCSKVAFQSCTQHTTNDLWNITLVRGKTYRLRFISTTAFSTFFVAVDNMNMTLIELDGVDYQATLVDFVELNSGQRASVLVTPTETGNFWIRARMDTSIFTYWNLNLNVDTLGIINVVDSAWSKPSTDAPTTTSAVLPPDGSVVGSFFDQELSLQPLKVVTVPEADVSLTVDFNIIDNEAGINLPVINNYTTVLPSPPVIFTAVQNANQVWAPQNNVYNIPGGGKVIEVVFLNEDTGDHPFHLHGHKFWIVGRGSLPYDPTTANLNVNNAPQRDTVRVPTQGYTVLRFIADNPGVWFFHCHMEWHLMGGLGIVFVEDAAKVATMTIPQSMLATCSN
jgi:iron transport multicopper oxidase